MTFFFAHRKRSPGVEEEEEVKGWRGSSERLRQGAVTLWLKHGNCDKCGYGRWAVNLSWWPSQRAWNRAALEKTQRKKQTYKQTDRIDVSVFCCRYGGICCLLWLTLCLFGRWLCQIIQLTPDSRLKRHFRKFWSSKHMQHVSSKEWWFFSGSLGWPRC